MVGEWMQATLGMILYVPLAVEPRCRSLFQTDRTLSQDWPVLSWPWMELWGRLANGRGLRPGAVGRVA